MNCLPSRQIYMKCQDYPPNPPPLSEKKNQVVVCFNFDGA